ncbi:MAG: hypothetical protein HY265_04540, partial [Deltaproteobacteria bacterium]|nr:hypothetical protein [Deltaproteobacteria bacterium]
LTLSILAILYLSFLASLNTYAATDNSEDAKTQQAISAFNEITDLWHDQKFDELYDKFADREKSTISRAKFIKRMTNEKKRLACCWQKAQDIKVKLYSSGKAVVSARLGFEDQSNKVDYVAAELPIYLKDEMWMVKVKDMLTAAPDLPKYKAKKHAKTK